MNRLYTFVLFILISMCVSAQKTYYYKLTKRVKDGVSHSSVSGGQFITFIDKACYESDKNGFSVEHGRLDYKYSENGIDIYIGGSYWGRHAVFLFKDDLSALNVKTEDGEVYVYKRVVAPSNVTTCSLIKKKSSGGGGNFSSANTYSSYSQGGYAGGGTYNSGNSGSSSHSSSNSYRQDKPQKTRHTCPGCNGSGKIVRNDGSISSYGAKGYMKKCPTCGYEYWSTTFHRHENCGICHGRGYKEY